MKLSTYIERLMERGWRREAAEEAAILAKEAGAEWDPEEPELPKRLCVGTVLVDGHIEQACLQIEGAALRHTLYSPALKEAAARYNALPRILADLEEIAGARSPLPVTTMERQHAASFASLVRSTLALERERLT